MTLHLRWLLLTKRPQLIRRRLDAALKHLSEGTTRGDLIGWLALWLSGTPPVNVWLGTTVENQAEADRRIPHLLAVPAGRHFLSCEPLLGHIDLSVAWNGESALDAECWGDCKWCENGHPPLHNCHRGRQSENVFMRGLGIDWIIAGGESGPKARPSHPDWFRSLRDQCVGVGVPFFLKQFGEWREFDSNAPTEEIDADGETADAVYASAIRPGFISFDGEFYARRNDLPEDVPCRLMERIGKKAAGATLDGREWREVPDA
jgi:protein gp37